MNVLDVKDLRKEYGSVLAVNNVSFSVEAGQVVGLIGPNGAGKTTLLRMLSTLLEATCGEITVLGYAASKDYLAIRERIGYLPDFFNLYDDLTIQECLRFFAKAYKINHGLIDHNIDIALNYVNLTDKKTEFIQNLSRGMVQRLGVATLLIRNPEIFLLDEPASGLDPKARIELRNVLKKLGQEGKTIIISSHILTELSDFCSQIIFLNEGKVVINDRVENIIKRIEGTMRVHIKVLDNAAETKNLFDKIPYVQIQAMKEKTFTVDIENNLEKLALLNKYLIDNGIKIIEFYEEKTNLEDIFMKIAS